MFPAGWALRNGSLETGSHGGGLLEGATLAQRRRSKSACSSACLLNVQSVPREGVTPASDIRAEPAACLRTEKVQGESRRASKPLQLARCIRTVPALPVLIAAVEKGEDLGPHLAKPLSRLDAALRGPRGLRSLSVSRPCFWQPKQRSPLEQSSATMQRRHCRMSRPPDGSEASTPTSATERRRRRRERERAESGQ